MRKHQGSSFNAADLLNLWFKGTAELWADLQQPDSRGTDSGASQKSTSTIFEAILEGWRSLGNIQDEDPVLLAGLGKAVFGRFYGSDPLQSPTPCEIVYARDHVQLRRYSTPGKAKLRHPLLVVYSLINRHHILDLQADRSLVRRLLARGIDVYMIDWGDPAATDHLLSIDDHVNRYLEEMVDVIRNTHHLSRINLMGVCMGGTLAVIYAALHPDKIANLITTATPTQFDLRQDPLHTWLKGLDVDAILGMFGNMPGFFLVISLLLLTPVRQLVNKYTRLLQKIENPAFVETFMRLERWTFDSPDIPGETFRQFVKDCYQKNLLIQNRMKVGGTRVDLKQISMPLLNIFGTSDHFVRPAACACLTGCVASRDCRNIGLDTGHLGLFVSSQWQKELSRQIADWLTERDATPAVLSPSAPGKPAMRGGPRHFRGRSKGIKVRKVSSSHGRISKSGFAFRTSIKNESSKYALGALDKSIPRARARARVRARVREWKHEKCSMRSQGTTSAALPGT